jgi:arginyl-tRNA synthetase
MILERLQKLVDACFEKGVSEGKWSGKAAGKYSVEVPRREGQGDYSTNMAMVMAGMEKTPPGKSLASCLTCSAKILHSSINWKLQGPVL